MIPFRASLLTIVLTFVLVAFGQQITLIPSSLPPCAQTCPVLVQAQSACVPPAALVSNPATYQSCFCQSAFLVSLRSTSNSNICAPQCPDGDFATIASWYKGMCGISGGAPAATTLTTSTTSAGIPTSTTGASSTAVGSVGGQTQPASSGPNWYANLSHKDFVSLAKLRCYIGCQRI